MVQMVITFNLSSFLITLLILGTIIGFWSDILETIQLLRRWNK